MRPLKQSWPITLGIILGVCAGVFLNKGLEHWNWPAFADGRRTASAHSETLRYAAKVIAPSVVNITSVQRVRMTQGGGYAFDDNGLPFYVKPQIKEGMYPRGVGSGFIFDAKNGFILTNNHVVDGGDSFIVRLADKREVDATLVGKDSQTDVAVLKINVGGLVAAEFGNSDEGCEVGDWVLAVGNPFGLLEQTVTAGIISAKGRKNIGLMNTNYEDFLQTDAAINMGNSGGPLVNLEGQVIGMNSAIYSKTGGYQGIGFAIPINQARKIAEQLVRNGSVVRGWLGVNLRELTPDEVKRVNRDYGALVDGVYFKSPAKTSGIIPGDVLLKIEGKPVRNSTDIPALVAEMKPGAEVTIQAIRSNGEERTFKVQIGVQPKDWGIRKNTE
jgi:serine protease Do